MTVQIIVGNCLDEMKKLKANSVHCAVSSPPYWGLRDYGIEPSIWGGDPKCEHVFADEGVERQIRTGMGLEALGERYRGGGEARQDATTFEFKRGFCVHCGTWRGAFGLEPTPELFIEHLVAIFEEVRRVLRPDGTLWLNLGDSYAGSGRGGDDNGTSTLQGGIENQNASMIERRKRKPGEPSRFAESAADKGMLHTSYAPPPAGLKPKDLVGIPWMAAFALRAAGWWLRQDIVWHKPNPMPESTTDRCTKAHEYLFLLTKSERYYYDAEAIAEDSVEMTRPQSEKRRAQRMGRGVASVGGLGQSSKGIDGQTAKETHVMQGGETRNTRSVWTVATTPFKEAHFATFPPSLIEPCVEAGTSARGCCVRCAAPWERIMSKSRSNESNAAKSGNLRPQGKGDLAGNGEGTDDDVRNGPVITTVTLGWWPTCEHDGLPDLPQYPEKPRRVEFEIEKAHQAALAIWLTDCRTIDAARKAMCEAEAGRKTKPAVVLDPFGGAGTSGLVADRLQRDAILIEMNPEYAAMARKRIDGEMPLFAGAAE